MTTKTRKETAEDGERCRTEEKEKLWEGGGGDAGQETQINYLHADGQEAGLGAIQEIKNIQPHCSF